MIESQISKFTKLLADQAMTSFFVVTGHRRLLDEPSLWVRYRQEWGRGFILLLPQDVFLPGSDTVRDGFEPEPGFVI